MNARRTRRDFLNLTGAGMAALIGGTLPGGTLPGATAPVEGPDADLVVFNARVYTVDPRTPTETVAWAPCLNMP